MEKTGRCKAFIFSGKHKISIDPLVSQKMSRKILVTQNKCIEISVYNDVYN